MLTLLLGRAGSGKTAEILNRISENVKEHVSGNIYIVPEQYSHDAEKEMAEVCPDDACLYAEVLSFSRLEGRVMSEIGGLREKTIDNGGRVLSMMRAVSESLPYLKTYSFGSNKAEFLKSLISTYDEFRSAEITVSDLFRASGKISLLTGDKIRDLSVIFENYERVKEQSGLDSGDRLMRLANGIAESSVGEQGEVFIDGFTDFTAQELRIIVELIKKKADITVALTTPDLNSNEPMFVMPSKTGRALMAAASERAVPCRLVKCEQKTDNKSPELVFLEHNITGYGNKVYTNEVKAVELYSGSGIYEELYLAAAKVRKLTGNGARYREIAIVSPDWTKYASAAKGVLSRYSIPFNSSDKEDILTKPVLSFVLSALDTVISNWDKDFVSRYMKTGFAGISVAEADILENYILKWNIRGSSTWNKPEGWKMHPDGYSADMDDEAKQRLESINRTKAAISEPLCFLEKGLARAETGGEKVSAVYDFLEKVKLYEKLDDKVEKLQNEGKLKTADELSQLWNIIINALEQFYEIIGDKPMESEEFLRLLRLLLGEYDVSTIPSAVDAVGVGDMSRMRGRGIKHLIILGATDTVMPSLSDNNELLSERDRDELRSAGLSLLDSRDDELARELGAIYALFSMPSETLVLTYPETARKSYMITRIGNMFGISEKRIDSSVFLYAPNTALELAASYRSGDRNAASARAYFESRPEYKDELSKLENASKMPRGRLDRMTAERLYGRSVSVSASKLDNFYSCRYSYFLKYGLKLKKREPAGLDAPETGTFIHYVLEKTFKEAENSGGLAAEKDDKLREIAGKYCKKYAEEKLGGLEEKTGRFKYLFSRLCADAERIVLNIANELRNSSFRPIDFELKFAPGEKGDLPSIDVKGETGVSRLIGIADRVDGWVHNGRLYIRVVDYKTGKKSFKLSDVYYGLNMQMLIYLFALKREGSARYAKEIVPAGVLYSPARDEITRADWDLNDAELEDKKLKATKGSGLLLNEPEVIEAMESGSKGKYLPIKLSKDGVVSGDCLAGAEELGALAKHVFMLIAQMGDELRRGDLRADPFFRSARDTACVYCDYFGACHFRSCGDEDRPRFISSLKKPEDAWERIKREK